MDFFKDIKTKIDEKSQQALKMTKDFADVTKLNSQISEIEANIKSQFIDLGKAYFSANKDDAENEYKDIISNINNNLIKIDELKEKIKEIKHETVCPKCGKPIPNNALFCSSCGAKIVIAGKVTGHSSIVCSGCGNPIENGALFCTSCGRKAEVDTDE